MPECDPSRSPFAEPAPLGRSASAARSTCDESGEEYTPRSPEHSILHRVVREQLEPFLARARSRERPAPHFVAQELRAFLRCGILAHGFLRLRCDDCGHDRLVPFSCKRRGFCPSCGGRRMADTAAHLVDRVLPAVPVRQWVLTLPYALRYRCAYDRALTSEVLRAFLRSLFAELRRRVPEYRGMSLHAAVAVPARDCRRLERLCRYVARPPLANDRLEERPDGGLLCA